jgi:Ca-activated chloride channel family protein
VSFLAPDRLWLLLIPAMAIVAYLVMLRRKQRYALRYTDLALLDKVAPDRPGWRRHLPVFLFLLAVSALVFSLARPVTAVQVPREQATVVVAVDVSFSMEADDVAPTRIEAAQEAALNFVDLAPEELRIGIVGFAGVALPAVAPTTDRDTVRTAIERLTLAEGTAVGEAIVASVELIAQEAAEDEEVPAAIVLLSDGTTTMGRPPEEAALAAADAEIPVSTISFGTDEGSIVFQGEVVPVPPDEAALRQVADTTGGRFFAAASSQELQQILDDVGSEVGFETEDRELWEWFLLTGVIILALAGAASLIWFSRLP